jgi:hypothetical protein
MLTISLADLDQIITFDGLVLEVFYGDKSARMHVGHIKRIEVTVDRKGKRTLHVETLVGEIPYMPFGEPLHAKMDELVGQVQSAMASFTP